MEEEHTFGQMVENTSVNILMISNTDMVLSLNQKDNNTLGHGEMESNGVQEFTSAQMANPNMVSGKMEEKKNGSHKKNMKRLSKNEIIFMIYHNLETLKIFAISSINISTVTSLVSLDSIILSPSLIM